MGLLYIFKENEYLLQLLKKYILFITQNKFIKFTLKFEFLNFYKEIIKLKK